MNIQTFAAVSLALGLAAPTVAQDSTARSPRLPPTPSAETVLRLREKLELTEEQVAQLDALRREALATRQAHMAQMMELRSRQLAGELSPEEWRAEITKQRDEARERMGTRDDRVAGVLTEAQRERLTDLRRQEWRQQGWMGRGERWGRGRFGPGMGGPGGPGLGDEPGPGPRWDRMPGGGMGPRGGPPGGWGMRRWGPPPDSEPDRRPDR